MSYYRFYFWTAFLVSAVLFFSPIAVEERVGLGLDKLVHFLLFGLMIYFAFAAYPQAKWKIIILLLAYTVVTEFVQENYIPYRRFDIFDIAADTAGIIAGGIYALTKRGRSFARLRRTQDDK